MTMISKAHCEVIASMGLGPVWIDRDHEDPILGAVTSAAPASAPASATTSAPASVPSRASDRVVAPAHMASASPAATASLNTAPAAAPALKAPSLVNRSKSIDAFSRIVDAPDPRKQAELRRQQKEAAEKEKAAETLSPADFMSVDYEGLVDLCQRHIRLMTPGVNTAPVMMDGRLGNPIMVVTDMPGSTDIVKGKPYQGRTGELFDAMMASIGLTREDDLVVTNVLKFRVLPGKKLSADDKACAMAALKRHIELAQPRVILAMGKAAAMALLNVESLVMSQVCGKEHVYPLKDGAVPLFVTLSPEQLVRNPLHKRIAWRDSTVFKSIKGIVLNH